MSTGVWKLLLGYSKHLRWDPVHRSVDFSWEEESQTGGLTKETIQITSKLLIIDRGSIIFSKLDPLPFSFSFIVFPWVLQDVHIPRLITPAEKGRDLEPRVIDAYIIQSQAEAQEGAVGSSSIMVALNSQ